MGIQQIFSIKTRDCTTCHFFNLYWKVLSLIYRCLITEYCHSDEDAGFIGNHRRKVSGMHVELHIFYVSFFVHKWRLHFEGYISVSPYKISHICLNKCWHAKGTKNPKKCRRHLLPASFLHVAFHHELYCNVTLA